MSKPVSEWHRLTKVDKEAKTALCAQCGPVPIYVRPDGRARCHPLTLEQLKRNNNSPKAVLTRWNKRLEYRKLKQHPCVDCEVEFPHYIMQFDHRPDEEKLFTISSCLDRYSWEKILAEIAKCDLVCCNCHGMRTWSRRFPDGDE